MNVLFNEISARALPADVQSSLIVLAKDIRFLRKLASSRLIYHVGDYAQLVSAFFQGAGSLQEVALKLNSEARGLVLALLQSTRQLAVSGSLHSENTSGATVSNLDSYVQIGLPSGVAMSLKDGSDWGGWELRYKAASSGACPSINLAHIGNVPLGFSNYSKTLVDFATAMIAVQGPQNLDGLLPNCFYSNFYLAEIEGMYQAEMRASRVAAFVTVGSAVALINGYVSRPDIDKKNKNGDQLRHIFFNARLDRYLSIDVAHGCFEVCAGDGSHLQEMNFYGKQLSGPEGNHSIRV